MVQNVKKMVVGLANWLDRPADQIWLATIFQTFYHSKWSKMWKKPVAGFANQLAGQTVHQTEFLPVTVFLRFGLFEVDLETKFSTKILTKQTFELLFDNRWHHHVQLILKFFWSKIFPKNDISNFLRSMSFLRSLSFFEIAVIFLNCCHFLKLISTLSLFQNPS